MAKYTVHLRLIEKLVADFLLSLCVRAEAYERILIENRRI